MIFYHCFLWARETEDCREVNQSIIDAEQQKVGMQIKSNQQGQYSVPTSGRLYLTLALSLFCSRMQLAHVALLFQKNSTKSVGDKTTRRMNVLYACVTYFISHRFLTYKHGIRVKPIFLMPNMNYRTPDALVYLNLTYCTTRHIPIIRQVVFMTTYKT